MAAVVCEVGATMHTKDCLNSNEFSEWWASSGVSSSDSTCAASEVASVQSETLPSESETASQKLSIEVPEGPLVDMFEDSEDDLPLSPSKSAKRRTRRRRQRDAMKAQTATNAAGYSSEQFNGSVVTMGALGLFRKIASPCSTRSTQHGIVSTSPSDASTRSPSNCSSLSPPSTPSSVLASQPPIPRMQDACSHGFLGTNPCQAYMARPTDASSRAPPAVGMPSIASMQAFNPTPQFAPAPVNHTPQFAPVPVTPQFAPAPMNPAPRFAAPAVSLASQFAPAHFASASAVNPAPQIAPCVMPMPPTPAPLQPPTVVAALNNFVAMPSNGRSGIEQFRCHASTVAAALAPPVSNFVAMPDVNNSAQLDPLRILFGVVGAPSKEELIARLQAAAYETYHD